MVASVEPVLRSLGDAVIGAQLRALKNGDAMETELDEVRSRRVEELRRLRGGAHPADALFAPDAS